MKTKDLWMAIAAFAVAGCSQNEITEINPETNPAIGFSVYTGTQTKGTVTNNEATGTGIKAKGFGVLGYYTGNSAFSSAASPTPNFMWNQQVTWKTTPSGHWEYTPLKYWPNTASEKISFFAYAPYEADQTTSKIILSAKDATGYPTLKFSVNMDAPKDMVDLVATNATQDNSGTEKTIDLTKRATAVPFKFLHTLSRANFFAKLDVAAITNTETKVFITGIKLRGTSNNSSSNLWATATYKFEDGTWDYTTGGTSAPATKQAGDVDLAKDGFWAGTDQTFGTNKFTTKSVALDAAATEVALFATNQYLFLIPPTKTGITANDDIQVQLEYSVVTLDANLTDGKSEIKTKAIVPLPKNTLKAGSAYKYIFTIGLEGVTVSATLTNWTNDNEATANDAPSVTATSASAADIKTAIAALNTIKNTNSNCNHFVINIDGATITSACDLSAATVGNFVSGDKIELNFTGTTNVTTSNITAPTNWRKPTDVTLSGAGTFILTKD